jgi:exodeoxyribonuclease V alpha subunit
MTGLRPLLGEEAAPLAPFVEAGLLDASAVHLARLIARTVPGVAPEVLLGAALAARAPVFGHVCVVIDDVAASVVVEDATVPIDSLPWPDPQRWRELLATSPAVRGDKERVGEVILPLVFDGTRLYLERYWRFEEQVADDLVRHAGADGGLVAPSPELSAVLDKLFQGADAQQRDAGERALCHRLTVLGGGPGTGKTMTISRLLAAAYTLALAEGRQLEVALAAPTGKAATRMESAVHEAAGAAGLGADVALAMTLVRATTLHRLLGITVGGPPRHNARNRLAHDLVVVDESSMVSLPLMARLLEAVRDEASLVLVGDPFQLASVEAGAVLGDVVGPPASRALGGRLADAVVLLERNHRFDDSPGVAELADAIRTGDADRALGLLAGRRFSEATWPCEELTWIEPGATATPARLVEAVADVAAEVVLEARSGHGEQGLGLASSLKVLCATRFGPLGVSGWTSAIENRLKRRFPYAGVGTRHYPGRPVIVTRNDYLNEVFNGDVGLVVNGPAGATAAFYRPDGSLRMLALSQLEAVESWWATTIHKSQGSEFEDVIVSLPPAPSPVLTRELLYTAVTRAKRRVTLVAEEASLRFAIDHPVARASGLRSRLWPEQGPVPPVKAGGGRAGPGQAEQLRFEL